MSGSPLHDRRGGAARDPVEVRAQPRNLRQAVEPGRELEPPPVPRGVRVAAEHMHEPMAGELQYSWRGGALRQQRGGHLHQRALRHQGSQPLVQVRPNVSLRVGDQTVMPQLREAVDRVREGVAERPGRRLEQDPSPAPAQRYRAQLGR